MKCPKCNRKTTAVEARDVDGYTRRRRECSEHGRFTTYEYTREQLRKMSEVK